MQHEFMNLMESYKKLKTERIDLRFRLLEIEEEILKLDRKAFMDASTQLDESGKKLKNTNDKMRETAKDEILEGNEEYIELKVEKLKSQKELEHLDIAIYVNQKITDMMLLLKED